MAKRAVKYSGKLSFAETAEALCELGQIEISTSSVWRLTERWGEVLRSIEAQEDEQANRTVEGLTTGQAQAEIDQRLGAAMDGAMIYIRGEEWKEFKVGCFFEVEQADTWDPETKDWVMMGHAHNSTYVSHLGGPETFGEKMWTEAKRLNWHQAIDTQVIGDGASWIWNLVSTYFYDAHQLIDWYHATEHLALVAQLAFGEGSAEAKRWFRQQETPLFQGHADRIAETISSLADQKSAASEQLLKQRGYFTNHQHRMHYLEMRSEGWVIGSGMVESGAKRFKDRFTRSGMRWSRAGAERLLPVRTALMSGRFDDRWHVAYNSPPI